MNAYRTALAAKHLATTATLRARGQVAQAARLERIAVQLATPVAGPAYRGVNMVIAGR